MPYDLHLLSPAGFRAAGVHCGLKTDAHAPDLGLLVADRPATAAAVFTRNKVVAAPVIHGREIIREGRLRAVVVNAGNANACTGEQGMRDCRRMAALTGEAVGAGDGGVLVSSTGVIGHPLPMDRIERGIADAAGALADGREAADAFARAILTTDLVTKTAAARGAVGGTTITVAGVCKGSGMIAPNMATMLAYLTTDANISPEALREALRRAVDTSFNTITVDGHTSTNDTVAALASGTAGGDEIGSEDEAFAAFAELLQRVCLDLALQIVADGEGATRMIEIRIEGAATEADAHRAAHAVADSPLVKCAVNGGDPNWGRVVSAVGYSGADLSPDGLRHWIGDVLVFANGMPVDFDAEEVAEHMGDNRVVLRVDLGVGHAAAACYTCDLSKRYVEINAEYHT